MIKIRGLTVFLAIATIALSQTVDLKQIYTEATLPTLGPEYSDPNFLKLIDNYFGCKTWSDGYCVECSASYAFNKNGICCSIDKHCKNFNTEVGVCQNCYEGYVVSSNGSCIVRTSDSSNHGCAVWANGACTKCSFMFFLNSATNTCDQVSSNCRNWKPEDGTCTECYYGYSLSNGGCSPAEIPPTAAQVVKNPLCKTWKGDLCLECADRAFLDTDGCKAVSDHCQTWDRQGGSCLTCYLGYEVSSGNCVASAITHPTDLGCKTWKGDLCLECSDKWVFNSNKACIPVSDLCKTNTEVGECSSCYYGYDLVNGDCLYSPSNNAKPSDGGCKTWSNKDNMCVECSLKWVFNENGNCVPVSDQCREHNEKGLCTSCFLGYDIKDGACLYNPNNQPSNGDAGCKVWNYNTKSCDDCSDFWTFDQNKVCKPVSDLCSTFDKTTGDCTSCYRGYDLQGTTCVYSPSNVAPPTDPGCKVWSNGLCLECSERWAFNADKICVTVSDLCKTSEGLTCTSCFKGYVLDNGACIFSPVNHQAPSDAGCKTWDWDNQICLECSNWWFFSEGKCVPVSDLCKTYNRNNGSCITCYKGYDLANGLCVLSTKNSQPSDLGCSTWDWDNQVCLACSKFWVMVDGVCRSVSPFCNTYDQSTGACTTCFTGYALNNGDCTPAPVSFCKVQDPNGCVNCYPGYALYGKKCLSVSSLADIALYYAECCP